jgi:hypothetical protein
MKRLIAALVLAGCAQPGGEVAWTAPQINMRQRDFVMARHVDRVAPEPQASGNNVLFLNFLGVTLSAGTDDAPINVSELFNAGTVAVPPFQLPPNAKFTLQQAKDSVTDRLKSFYKPFDVQIVTTRPASGNYTMIAVGGKNTLIPGLSGAAGVSPLDCDATTQTGNPNNVVYDFSEEQPPEFGGLPSIAVTAAHESGHSYGLEHTDNASDIMYSVQNPNITIDAFFKIRFTTGNYSSFNGGGEVGRCAGRTDPLDNVALLTSALGSNPSPGDTNAPTVMLTFPTLQQVPTQFPIRINASDNNTVQRVEVYKNLELISVLTSAPYQAVVNAADNETFYLTVEAWDADANHAVDIKAFIAQAATPQLCPNGDGDCKTNQVCKQGICRYPIGTPCTVPQQCEYSCKQPVGVQQTICTNTCNGARPCPAGNHCGADNLCAPGDVMPMLKLLGESCAMAEECESMRCDGTCVAACDDLNPCGDGKTCSVVTGGAGCILTPPTAPSNGCSVAPHPVAPPLFLLLLPGLLIRRKSLRQP